MLQITVIAIKVIHYIFLDKVEGFDFVYKLKEIQEVIEVSEVNGLLNQGWKLVSHHMVQEKIVYVMGLYESK